MNTTVVYVIAYLLQIGLGTALIWAGIKRAKSKKPLTKLLKVGVVIVLIWGGCMIAGSLANILLIAIKTIRN
jgi:hypothetical protein